MSRSGLLTVNPPSPSDAVSITRAEFVQSKKQLQLQTTSTSASAVLKAYVTSTGALIGTLTNNGGGKYSGAFGLAANPGTVTVRSSLGGGASRTVSLG